MKYKVGDLFKVLAVDGTGGCEPLAIGKVFECCEVHEYSEGVYWPTLLTPYGRNLFRASQVEYVSTGAAPYQLKHVGVDLKVCSCPIVTLMQQGCSCGGK